MAKPRPGPLRYDNTPYSREIIDCLAPDHPAHTVAFMKGAQIGASATVIIPGILWMIMNNPGNCYFMVGSPDLIEKATEKLDIGIDNARMRAFIKPQAVRKKAQKSGDTNFKKEFAGGYVNIGSANNHKAIRDVSLQFGFFDDLEAFKTASKESGNTLDLLEVRFRAYRNTRKIFLISTPERKSTSNIEPAFLLGDQRYFNVECPCCHSAIVWEWSTPEGGGITWQLDNHGRVIESSVGYVCQKCSGFFTDKNKHRILNEGIWVPTAEPSKVGYYSYHCSSLYAPTFMDDWVHYAQKFVECNPAGQPRLEHKHQTFVNTCLGLTYDPVSTEVSGNKLMLNAGGYFPFELPEKLSLRHGNGRIVLITCAADLNGKMKNEMDGKVDDARLDYEVLAHTESGATYSLAHGSIGTFIKGEIALYGKELDRVKWTYEHNQPNSVWVEFEKFLGTKFKSDYDGREMGIYITALDCGAFATRGAYPFIEKTNRNVVGVKGDPMDNYLLFGGDKKVFKVSLEVKKLFIVQGGIVKDRLAQWMNLNWEKGQDQPENYMNYPAAKDGMYEFDNYFSHYESEQRKEGTDTKGNPTFRWEKKQSNSVNHMWDCRVYNIVAKEIVLAQFSKAYSLPDLTWRKFADAMVLPLQKIESKPK